MECDCCKMEFFVDELEEFDFNGDRLCENCLVYAKNFLKKE
jgi:hypothetical protein